jgi:hypothetical protein
VVFELLDGTKITADLYPDATVWGESSYLQQLIQLYNTNPDIGQLVILATAVLILLLIINIIRMFMRMNKAIYESVKVRKAPSMEQSIKNEAVKSEKNGNNESVDEDNEIVSKSDL